MSLNNVLPWWVIIAGQKTEELTEEEYYQWLQRDEANRIMPNHIRQHLLSSIEQKKLEDES